MPSSPRSQKLWTLTFRSAKTVGVVSAQGVEDLDHAALLRDEDPTIAGEPHHRRVGQAAENSRLLKPRREGRRMR